MDIIDKERLATIEERTRCLPALVEKVCAHDVAIAVMQTKMARKKAPVSLKGLLKLVVIAGAFVAGFFGFKAS